MDDSFQLYTKTLTQKTLHVLPLHSLTISRFNARRQREPSAITALATRIQRNGFESTRALWAYAGNASQYEVFAGGTRLRAAQEAGLATVPVLVHVGLSWDEVGRV